IPRTDARSDSGTRRSAQPIKASRVIHSPFSARKVRPDSVNETATTIDAAAPALPRLRHAAGELDRRLYLAGVTACTAAVAVFLLVQVRAGRPHEDETLPLFVGRQPLDGLFDIVLGKRGGAPVHFLLAWVVAHAGGGLETMRFFFALFAVASIPAIAVLGNRL